MAAPKLSRIASVFSSVTMAPQALPQKMATPQVARNTHRHLRHLIAARRCVARNISTAARPLPTTRRFGLLTVSLVGTGPLEDHRYSRSGQSLHGAFTLGAGFHRLVLHVLELLESVLTLLTFVFICGHCSCRFPLIRALIHHHGLSSRLNCCCINKPSAVAPAVLSRDIPAFAACHRVFHGITSSTETGVCHGVFLCVCTHPLRHPGRYNSTGCCRPMREGLLRLANRIPLLYCA